MIEMAGGAYALDSLEVGEEDDNALSTMNIEMEAIYELAVDSDIIIYNSAIESDLYKIDDLIDLSPQFADFKAVKSGNVWCTNKSMFQKTTGVAGMIVEMNRIFAGAEDDEDMEYFHKLN
jgi:iron complex transport system substrate-binding protein